MSNSRFNEANTPFHSGELAMQKLAGEADIATMNGAVISNQIFASAAHFIAQQNMLMVTSMDYSENIWISVIIGNPGFIQAINSSTLLLETSETIGLTADPLWKNIQHVKEVGMIIIEFSTRRRYRVNGNIKQVDQNKFEIRVVEAYPNCPKFIQRRELILPKNLFRKTIRNSTRNTKHGTTLTSAQQQLIASGDTFFVGTANRNKESKLLRCDASHRGGLPGFVEVINESLVSIPDYQGNSMFNTLGNIHSFGRAGIIIFDFKSGLILQLTGKAKVVWKGEDEQYKSAGSHRFWLLFVEHWIESKLPPQLNWNFYDYSPHNPEQLSKIKSTQYNQALILKLSNIVKKNSHINLYQFENNQADFLPAFEAGSHLPIFIKLDNGEMVERHYSLLPSILDASTNLPKFYQFAVQIEPLGRGGSKAFHRDMQLGSIITAKCPSNEFPLSKTSLHTVLIAGGIGITPMLSILSNLVEKMASFEVHYAAAKESDLVFKSEVLALAGKSAHFYFSNGESSKRIDLERLMKVPSNDTHFYICGPNRMIESCRDLGKVYGWKPSQIHFESFASGHHQNDSEFELILKQSGISISVLSSQSILDALIDKKVSVPFSCARGDCGVCVTEVVSGEVDHRDTYLNKQQRKKQMCICVSRAKGNKLSLNI